MPYKIFNLQLFGEEGTVAGTDGISEGGTGAAVAENPTADGVATEGEGEQAAPAEDQGPTWDELIKGKYKKDYDKAVKAAVQKRFRNQQDLQRKIDMVDPIVRQLAQRYGVAANPDGSISIEALQAQMDADNSMYEQEAFQRGMSVEDLKQIKQLERENMMLRREHARSAEQQEWDEIVSQASQTKQVYPDFDLDAEMQNPQFGRLVATMQKSGFPNAVQTAYEACHRDEIMGGAMRYAVQQTEKKLTSAIQSGLKRPSENGISHQSTAAVGNTDPSKLTRQQIADIKRRAEMGERITF